MKLNVGFAGFVALAGMAVSASGQVFSSTAVPAGISDNSLTTVDLVVAGGPASISEVHVVVNITHTYDGDLDIVLVAPDFRYVHLTSDNGGTGENFTGTRFSQCGAQNITAGTVPYSGNFIPEGGDATTGGWAGPALPGPFAASLANLNGMNANGTWQLWVYDDAGIDQGSVDSFTLEFNGQFDPLGPSAPTGSSPGGIAAASPASGVAGGTSLLTLVASPGGCPLSTGITVTADLTALGGSATQAMFDNGTNGDATAGDGVYSYNMTTPLNQGGGTFPIVMTISDAQSRSDTRTANYLVAAPPAVFIDLGSLNCGETTINLSIDAPGEVKWYRLVLPDIADPAGFLDIWTTLASTINFQDTELALYDGNGVLKATDDDDGGGSNSYLSEISFGATNPIRETGGAGWTGGNGRDGALSAGVHWLVVSGFNLAPANGWVATSTSTYVGSVEVKTNLQHGSCAGNCVADTDDGTGTGNGDGAVTIDDLLYFLVRFEAGC